jgi:hypothetical protein
MSVGPQASIRGGTFVGAALLKTLRSVMEQLVPDIIGAPAPAGTPGYAPRSLFTPVFERTSHGPIGVSLPRQ